MTDGHTKKGAWTVKLELTEDQVQQLIRSMDMAKSLGREEPHVPPTMNMIAHRAFLEDILDNLYKAVKEQKEAHEKEQASSPRSAQPDR